MKTNLQLRGASVRMKVSRLRAESKKNGAGERKTESGASLSCKEQRDEIGRVCEWYLRCVLFVILYFKIMYKIVYVIV
jgi:hypothetical protein